MWLQLITCLSLFLARLLAAVLLLPPRRPRRLHRRRSRARPASPSLKFTGVKAVKTGPAQVGLATVQSSKLPWGTKHYFTREQFEADLKRIAAFYKDRGFPDAKVPVVRRQAERQAGRRRRSRSTSTKGSRSSSSWSSTSGSTSLPARAPHRAEAALPAARRRAARSRAGAGRCAKRRSTRSRITAFPTPRSGSPNVPGTTDHVAGPDAHGDAGHAGALRPDRGRRATPASATTWSTGSYVPAELALPPQPAAGEPAQALRPRDVPVRQHRAGRQGRRAARDRAGESHASPRASTAR